MALEDDLVRKGYLPENLPPAFYSDTIADSFGRMGGGAWWSKPDSTVRPATYNASKRGLARRTFSVVHPRTIRDLAKFVGTRWQESCDFFRRSRYSLSSPQHTAQGDRAIAIRTHNEVESIRLSRLSQFRFIAKTDISRFYHSIYTHSIPWAYHGKAAAKLDRDPSSEDVFFNRADCILRCGQDGQTIGIPVGPDVSRIFSETIATAIDIEFQDRCDVHDFDLIRHVDDVWIGANTHAEAERALWRYREAIREYELDINESKTRIYSSDFQFSDRWPAELSIRLGAAIDSTQHQASERMRAALEHAFGMAVSGGDDGVLKYVIRYLDRHDTQWRHWESIEPFLKRSLVHFGHTVDYVTRVLIWRNFVIGDLDKRSWSKIIGAIIDRHGRIGNDSEVCWAIYACARLDLSIRAEAAENIIRNCGALPTVALLNCIEKGLVNSSAFGVARERFRMESARGPFWPVLMEWGSRQWPGHNELQLKDAVVEELIERRAVLFDPDRLPPVFNDVEPGAFGGVSHAIERRTSIYDEDEEEDDEDEQPF